MKAAQIRVGGIYAMKVSGTVQKVRVDAIRETSDHKGRSHTRYDCTNLATGRRCSARSATKFRSEVKPASDKPAKIDPAGPGTPLEQLGDVDPEATARLMGLEDDDGSDDEEPEA